MASLKDIRARIETTKNTQQITKAMKLVSAAKLRKAQHQIVNMRPYAHSLLKVIANIAVTERVPHPLLVSRPEPKKILLMVLTSDRGLCGGFNGNIIKFTEQYLKQNSDKYEKTDIIFIGRKAADYFAKRSVSVVDTITKLDKDISYDLASGVAEKAMQNYLDGHYDEIRMVYNEFKSAISQKVVCETLLPVDLTKQTLDLGDAGPIPGFSTDMIYEPDPERVIDQLLVKHFSVQVFRCMAESVAAEHGARMTAMENATNNARDVLNKLTLTYNKLRQEKITTELIEIVSGAESLK
ncbi:MAG: ATP synthase gamma chain [Oligoflexia bacterium]|nr:MAG: ATP synthase gamma chain [Oligoflexia bacterium]